MFQEFVGVEIESIAACVPKNTVLNETFADLLSPKEMRIFEKTVGITERRWAEDSVTSSDLGFAAAQHLFEKINIDKNDVESLVFISQTPDFKIPFTSNILQGRLGLKTETLCLDINAGCAGFVQGLSTSFSLAKSLPKGKKIILIIAETLSKILSSNDRSTTMLFGDGATALIIENTGNENAKSSFNFFSDGLNSGAIQIPDGGYRNAINKDSLLIKTDESGNQKTNLNLEMDGPKVFDFTLREIAKSIENLISKSLVEKEKIDYFLLHQSNQFIIKQIASQLRIDSHKMLLNIKYFGNTSGVSIPLLICSNKEKIQNSKRVLISGYGSGLNWGNCLLSLSKTEILELKEI